MDPVFQAKDSNQKSACLVWQSYFTEKSFCNRIPRPRISSRFWHFPN